MVRQVVKHSSLEWHDGVFRLPTDYLVINRSSFRCLILGDVLIDYAVRYCSGQTIDAFICHVTDWG